MVSLRRQSRWKGPLGPAEEPPLHPVDGEACGGDEPSVFLRDIDLNQPPPHPRGRGRGRPRGSGRGRGRGRGGGGRLHLGHHQRGRGRWRQGVPRGSLLRSDLSSDGKSVILALAAAACNDSDKSALATCDGSNTIRNNSACYLDKKGPPESYVYLRESGFREIIPVAIPVGLSDGICDEVPLIDFGGDNTPTENGEQPQKEGQPNRIAEQRSMLWERDGKMAKAKGCGRKNSSEHMASRGKRKSINGRIEENNPKKACAMMSKLNNKWELEATARREMLEKLGLGIKSGVEAFEKDIGDVFIVPSFDPPLDKYDGVPGVTLRASDITDSSEQDLFTYVQEDMKTLQGLANAETLDKAALSRQINKSLVHWTKLFSSHISGGMAAMIQALNELKGLLASDAISPLPFDGSGVTERKARVEEALQKAAALQQSIPEALKEIDQVEATVHVEREALAALKVKQQRKIARLKASLELAEKGLKETENQETQIEQFLKESEASRQDSIKYSDILKKTIDNGELAKTEVQKFMQYIGVGSESAQPKPVRSLISYMQAASCEG